ncbi:energy transducer TonB [Pedobacter agri]|uniref:energy transducer TonB n=1 Tax=Pedobacter agri TaxID=454586 RepID=UPI00292F1FE0|nr:energy transducer TonB [Pedobacter agri]
MKKRSFTLLLLLCFGKVLLAQQSQAPSQNLLFLVDGKFISKSDAARINRDSIETLTIVKEKQHITIFGVNDEAGLAIVITKAKKNSAENLLIREKISKINFKTKPDAVKAPAPAKPSRDSIANGTFEFTVIQKQPEFPGGIKAFYSFLNENIKYPKEAAKRQIQGRVFLSFIVEKDGSLTNIKVIRGLSYDINDEAVRVLSASPNWNPGIQFGVPVRVRYNININFSLNK